jgi:peptidyl-prolyl cis-trans isomerase SurA
VADLSEKIAADSGRFELNQLPNLPKGAKAGSLTGLQNNPADGSVSFAYIIRLYPAGQQRSFADARGLVINDYQQELEKRWLEKLRQKYPVRVNETELSKLK